MGLLNTYGFGKENISLLDVFQVFSSFWKAGENMSHKGAP